MTKTQKHFLERYPSWSDSKRRKYNRVIFLKYGSGFLKTLQIAAKNAQGSVRLASHSHPTQGNEMGESDGIVANIEDKTSSGESDPPVTDVEVLAPISKLPDEIFSEGSGNLENQKGTDDQNATVELGSPCENHGKASQAIKTVNIKEAWTKNSSDSSDGLLMGESKTYPDGELEPGVNSKVANRRKKRAPKRIVKRQRTYEADGDTSEESNADVRNKFLKISLDEEMDARKEESDWNTVGDEETTTVMLHHPEETETGEREMERDTPTLEKGGKPLIYDKMEEEPFDTSLIIDTSGSEQSNPDPNLLPKSSKEDHDKGLEYSSEGRCTPQNNWGSIPKRKTARKKPGLSSFRSDANMRSRSGSRTIEAVPALPSSELMNDEDGTENDKEVASPVRSERESLTELKEKVLTGESPKLKVICSQMRTSSAFGGYEEDVYTTRKKKVGASLFGRVQSDILFDTGEEEKTRKGKGSKNRLTKTDKPVDGAQIEQKVDGFSSQNVHPGDVPREETSEMLTSPKSVNVESSDWVVGGIVKTPEMIPPRTRTDDVGTHFGDTRQLPTTEQEKGTSLDLTAITPPQFTQMECMVIPEESPLIASKTVNKGRRTSIWEGSLRQSPSKFQPYQAPPSSSKKKNRPKEGSKVVTPQKYNAAPVKQGPVVRNYRKVAIPTPITSLNSPRENVEPSQEETPITSKMKERFSEKPEFSPGNLVWGRMKGFPWWPGMIVHHYAMKRREPPPPGHTVIQWFGDMKFSQLKVDQVSSFTKKFKENINMIFVKKRNLYKKALFQALKVAALQVKKSFGDSMPEFPKKDTSEEDQQIFETTFNDMISWAEGNFLPHGPLDLVPLPEHVARPATPPPSSPKKTAEERVSTKEGEKWIDSLDQRIKELKKGEISLEEFCIGCGSKSLADRHPLFVGGLCEVCRIEYLETAYMFADDGYQCYCCVCAEGDELALCENKGCYRSFCITCVELMISPVESKKIKTQDPWICYMCQPENSFGCLKIREDWPRHLHELFGKDQDVDFAPLRTWPPKPLEERKPVRVLSLFDGIGTGMFVLSELGFKVEVYIASEVNPDAIKVSSVRQKGAITHVGDVRKITSKELAEWGPFDLLIGGSPCNDLSIVNPARKGIYGGTGVLFFEYMRILRLLQLTTPPDRPLFWFFENVVFMGHQDKMTISRFLECNPVLVDAKDVSPAHRARYFWGNIPGMNRPSAALLDSPLRLQDCLEPHCNRKAKFSKVRTITTRANSLKQGEVSLPVEMDGKEDTLWCTELERLFGFPDHYTDVNNLSRGDRQKLLGQCWSVPVIHHLLAPLKDYYQCQ